MPRSNIILFTGANIITLRRDIEKWRAHFVAKYGAENISRIDADRLDVSELVSEVLSQSLFSATRLIILDGIPPAKSPTKRSKKGSPETDTIPDDDDEDAVVNESNPFAVLCQILPRVPDTTFLLFISPIPDEKTPLYRALQEIATIREYPLSDAGLLATIREELPGISESVARELLARTAGDPVLLDHELTKLSLATGTITSAVISRETADASRSSSTVWTLTDALTAGDRRTAHRILRELLRSNNIFALHAIILGTLRTYLAIHTLHDEGMDVAHIAAALEKKPFMVEKSLRQARMRRQIVVLFTEMVDIERRSKTGRGIGESEESMQLLMEMAILRMGEDTPAR